MPTSRVKITHNSESSIFNKDEVYQSTIAPLVDQLVKMCAIYDIPVFIAACTANDNVSSTYHYDGISPEGLNLELSNDFFGKMLCVTRGFDVVPAVNDAPEDTDEQDTSLRRISAESFEEEDDM